MSTVAPEPTSRDERRRRTEATILAAARALFAEAGYERATIRGVAGRAGVDPGLVMQYFGSKEGLFAAATHSPAVQGSLAGASREQLPAAALADLFARLDRTGDREAAVALMRSCLTHPEANRVMRDEVLCSGMEDVVRTIGGPDAELRAELMTACLMGVGMARYLLELPGLAEASQEDIERLMEPVLRTLVSPPD